MEFNNNNKPQRARMVDNASGRSNRNPDFKRGDESPYNRDTDDGANLIRDYHSEWISGGATDEMVRFAEKMGKTMAEGGLTNSKIRSIYGEIKRIQSGDFDKLKSSFYLLKPKVAYAVGRDKNNRGLQCFKKVFDRSYADVKDKKSYENFCNLIEAILAYHKANGGKD